MRTQPTITQLGAVSSKTAATTTTINVTGQTFDAREWLAMVWFGDNTTGTISVSDTGTATTGAWFNYNTAVIGSQRVAYFPAFIRQGTLTSVTVTHPSTAARVARLFRITNTDGPQSRSLYSGDSAAALAPVLAPTRHIGDGLRYLAHQVAFLSSAAANLTPAVGAGWELVAADASTAGTTGGGAATNRTIGAASFQHPALPTADSPAVATGNRLTTPATATTQGFMEVLWSSYAEDSVGLLAGV